MKKLGKWGFQMSDWEVVTEKPQEKSAPMQSDWDVHPYEDNQESAWKRIPRDVLIGLTHAGRNLHNLPHDLSALAEWPIEKIRGKHFEHPFSSYLPNDTENYAETWGQKGSGTTLDNALQKGVEYAPDVIGGLNALRSLKILPHLTRKGASKNLRLAQNKMGALESPIEDEIINLYHGTNPKSANKILQEGLNAPKYSQDYSLLTNNPSTAFEYGVRRSEDLPDILKASIPKSKIHEYLHPENTNWSTQSLKPRGHEESQIFGIKKPIPKENISLHDYENLQDVVSDISGIIKNSGKKVNIPHELIEDAAQFLPKTTPYKNLLKDAQSGDYNSLFRLQSDLGSHASDYAKSLFSAAERAHGRAGMATRKELLKEIHNALKANGHEDVSELLRKGQEEYRRYAKFKPYRNAILAAGAAYSLPRNVLIDLAKKMATMGKD